MEIIYQVLEINNCCLDENTVYTTTDLQKAFEEKVRLEKVNSESKSVWDLGYYVIVERC